MSSYFELLHSYSRCAIYLFPFFCKFTLIIHKKHADPIKTYVHENKMFVLCGDRTRSLRNRRAFVLLRQKSHQNYLYRTTMQTTE
jgi:hypothetical protein